MKKHYNTDFECFIIANKLKQNQVADYLGVSSTYINQVVQGKSSLSYDKMKMLVESEWDVSMLKFPKALQPKETATGVTIAADVWHVIKCQAESLKTKDEQTAEVIALLREELRKNAVLVERRIPAAIVEESDE